MLSNFKTNSSAIIKFLGRNPNIEKCIDDITYDNLSTLLKLTNNEDLSKIVFKSNSNKYFKLIDCLNKYNNESQFMIYIDALNLYLLFDDFIYLGQMISEIKALPTKPSIYQFIKKEFKQKLTLNIIDETYIKMAKLSLSVTIEQNSSFMWELTINDRLYNNYDECKTEYDAFVEKYNAFGKVFISTLLKKKIYEYTRYNISSMFIDSSNVLKNILYISDNRTIMAPVVKKEVNKKNQITLDWISSNPPLEKEQKLDYYDRYNESTIEKKVSKNMYTQLVKSLGYVESKLNGRIYWIKEL